MRPNVEYCYHRVALELNRPDQQDARNSLENLYNETKRLQGVIESFVEDAERKARAEARKSK